MESFLPPPRSRPRNGILSAAARDIDTSENVQHRVPNQGASFRPGFEADVVVVVVARSMRRGWRRKATDTYSHNDIGLGNLQVYNVADAVPNDFLGQLYVLSV